MPEQLPALDYPKLFQDLPDSYLLLTPDGTIVTNSDQHVAVSLLPREKVVGRNIFDAFPSAPESQRALYESHEYVRQHKQAHTMALTRYDLERPAELGGGTEERYWQITHYPLLDSEGNLQYILQRPQDVTEKHLAEQRSNQIAQELAESQDQARFVLEALPVMIWTSQADGSITAFNQRWLSFTGRSKAESMGWGWTQDIHPEEREAVTQRWQQAAAAGEEFQLEFRLRRHDGHYRWVLVRCVPRVDSEGHTASWVGGGTDIHEQKELVQEMLEANERQAELSDQAYQAYQLARSQKETFHNLFEQAPALICILRGPEHRFEFVNTSYQSLFPGRPLVGRPLAEALPEVAEQGFGAVLDGVYSTGEPFYGNELLVRIDRHSNGELQDGYFNFTYQLFAEGDQKAGITVFAFDVTDLVLARKALEKLRDDAATNSR
ncbi:PAS domain-containing protein [Hymenobacter lucidus]|uniref:histidine kinase n=1 Tax=Hymenobacter lucidus TaxID=2880930 RepID=A0ABS8ASD9_9BACT|nr:PAS domain-containing protein [Hymenobacter lucidus]MCB2409118.1 PAS domain-containing protein [Hymenobacter lucidus]